MGLDLARPTALPGSGATLCGIARLFKHRDVAAHFIDDPRREGSGVRY